MNNGRFLLHRRALTAYPTLTAAEREALETTVASLADLPESDWPQKGARRLPVAEPLYLVPVDESLRAFVRPATGGRPEVLDIARQETLDLFAPHTS